MTTKVSSGICVIVKKRNNKNIKVLSSIGIKSLIPRSFTKTSLTCDIEFSDGRLFDGDIPIQKFSQQKDNINIYIKYDDVFDMDIKKSISDCEI